MLASRNHSSTIVCARKMTDVAQQARCFARWFALLNPTKYPGDTQRFAALTRALEMWHTRALDAHVGKFVIVSASHGILASGETQDAANDAIDTLDTCRRRSDGAIAMYVYAAN